MKPETGVHKILCTGSKQWSNRKHTSSWHPDAGFHFAPHLKTTVFMTSPRRFLFCSTFRYRCKHKRIHRFPVNLRFENGSTPKSKCHITFHSFPSCYVCLYFRFQPSQISHWDLNGCSVCQDDAFRVFNDGYWFQNWTVFGSRRPIYRVMQFPNYNRSVSRLPQNNASWFSICDKIGNCSTENTERHYLSSDEIRNRRLHDSPTLISTFPYIWKPSLKRNWKQISEWILMRNLAFT